MLKKLTILPVFLSFPILMAAQGINIWEGTICNKKVRLFPYMAEGKGNIAIVVCPGGSYFWHDIDTEGHDVAKWLQSNGISAFVLNYRTAYVPAFIFRYRYIVRGNRYPDPQADLQRAIIYIKAHSEEFGINPEKVGAMGFSAGGHLVMSVAEMYDSPLSRPSFVAPIYPVVTMSHPCVHKRSRRALLGEWGKNDRKMRDSLSLEHHVPTDCPPVFLVNCIDDPIVQYRNSELLDSALTHKGITHKYIQYKTGGHGFGSSDDKGTEESRTWKQEFIRWIKSVGL